MPRTLRILALEPYHGGSHAQFLEGLRARSRHRWTLLAMPARKWKWRMRGAALHLVREAAPIARDGFDLVLASDFLSVADWKALAPRPLRDVPIVTYFHENQLSYPLEPGQRRDFQYGFTNLTTCLASREVWFNSGFHLDAFTASVDRLLGKMPDFVPEGLPEAIRERARVVPPGLDLQPLVAGRSRPRPPQPPLTILWNHRWEYDKNPEAFFEVLFFLAQEGVPFRLTVVGETFRKWPPVFEEARRRLGERLVQFGYVPERADYEALVRGADVVVSTAVHEFFGLSVVEAVAAGCFPLLPRRLSYPEIVPEPMHETFLYDSERELRVKLTHLLEGGGPWDKADALGDHVQQYDWANLVRTYDAGLVRAAGVSDA